MSGLNKYSVVRGNEDNILDILDELTHDQLDLLDHLLYVVKCEKNFYEEEDSVTVGNTKFVLLYDRKEV